MACPRVFNRLLSPSYGFVVQVSDLVTGVRGVICEHCQDEKDLAYLDVSRR